MRNSQLAGTSQLALTSEFMPDNCRRLIEEERHNERMINLYSIGNDWIAIEQSAYMLSKLFPKCAALRANIPGYPFPVVMTMIKDNELRAYTREHIIQKPTPSHCIILTTTYDRPSFARWHRQQLNA